MNPYYQDELVTLIHADCRDVLPGLEACDHVITDPPYDEHTHSNARTMRVAARVAASTGKRGIVSRARLPIDFDPLSVADVALTAGLLRYARRWCLIFCSLEQLGDYKRATGDAWVRAGIWRRPDAMPQVSGDRPGQPAEGIAILHNPGMKRWNGGGHHAYFEHNIVKFNRLHPTQKPLRLMTQLVSLFTDPGETVLDPFAGSGTTGLACKQLGRRCILIEREERYCAVAAERLRQECLTFEAPAPAPRQEVLL